MRCAEYAQVNKYIPRNEKLYMIHYVSCRNTQFTESQNTLGISESQEQRNTGTPRTPDKQNFLNQTKTSI